MYIFYLSAEYEVIHEDVGNVNHIGDVLAAGAQVGADSPSEINNG
jgi:hypothetical protein